MIYRFGGFELEPERRSLRSTENAQPVALTAKVFDTLLYLIEHRGHLIEKRELLEAVWPNVIVEEANLPQTISMLRRALGEDARAHEYIATIAGRGYLNSHQRRSKSWDRTAPPRVEAEPLGERTSRVRNVSRRRDERCGCAAQRWQPGRLRVDRARGRRWYAGVLDWTLQPPARISPPLVSRAPS